MTSVPDSGADVTALERRATQFNPRNMEDVREARTAARSLASLARTHQERAERLEDALREILHEVGSVTQTPHAAAAAAHRLARAALVVGDKETAA